MKHPNRSFFAFCICLFSGIPALHAQLDTIHYIPPMHSRDTDDVDQFLYLSTPETIPFPVTVSFRHFNPATSNWAYMDSIVTVSNSNPATIGVGFTTNSTVLALVSELNQPLAERGIIAKGQKKFYANLRVRQDAQAGALTAKGRSGLGTTFRIAHLVNSAGVNRSNFIGIMATENNTQVSITGYAPTIALQTIGPGVNEVYTPGSSITFTLNAGESYVLSAYCRVEHTVNIAGLMGTLVSSTKPIAVNCGSWWAGHPNAGIDIGIDQVAPLEWIGTAHVLVRGDGSFTGSSQNLETPIVVAHYDDTEVFINGSTTPEFTLDAGQHAIVPPTFYVNQQNMYIKTSEPVFMYQSLAGGQNTNNAGFNNIPPLSCQISATVNNIPIIDFIGNLAFMPRLFIITQENCPPVVEATGNTGVLSDPYPVPGSNGFVTYIGTGYTGNLRITSDCSLHTGILGRSGDRGWGSYFSGFGQDVFPEVTLEADPCQNTLLVHREYVDTLQWYFNGQAIPAPAPDSLLTVTENGVYTVTGLLSLACETLIYDTTTILVDWLPEVQIQTTPAGCTFGQLGSIAVQVLGVPGSFTYTVNNGSPQTSGLFTDLQEGTHVLRITDSNGCVLTDTAMVTTIPVQAIADTICIGSSIVINGVLFDTEHPADTLIYEAVSGCDSVFVIQISFQVPDTVFQQETTCDPTEVGQETLLSGCDSIVIIHTQLEIFSIAVSPPNPTLPLNGGLELTLLTSPPGSIPASVLWSPAESLSCNTCLTVLANPATTTTFEVLAASAGGCLASASVTVQVLQQKEVFAPNVFLPNSDGINDRFTLFAGADVELINQLMVFDRWGGLVFEGADLLPNSPSQGWDGRRKGEDAHAGVYVWFARVAFANGEVVGFKGDVTLMR